MKKLPRIIMRQENEPGYEEELWQPTWKCFCCHDSGIVIFHLAAMVIEEFNPKLDKLPRCQNHGCSAGSHYDNSPILSACIDYRLTPEICLELDTVEREAWRETLLMQHQKLKAQLNELKEQELHLAQKMKMPGTCDRTANDNREVAIRHGEIKNADPQKLVADAHDYLGDDYWREGSS
jgi:hypothetical protein